MISASTSLRRRSPDARNLFFVEQPGAGTVGRCSVLGDVTYTCLQIQLRETGGLRDARGCTPPGAHCARLLLGSSSTNFSAGHAGESIAGTLICEQPAGVWVAAIGHRRAADSGVWIEVQAHMCDSSGWSQVRGLDKRTGVRGIPPADLNVRTDLQRVYPTLTPARPGRRFV